MWVGRREVGSWRLLCRIGEGKMKPRLSATFNPNHPWFRGVPIESMTTWAGADAFTIACDDTIGSSINPA
jgi:hypothetical protein